jgi:hypothetical protein
MRISYFFFIALLISISFGKKSEESTISSLASKVFWGSLTAVGGVIVKEVKEVVVDKIFGSEDE